ncbi:hypothetical protein L218DRAFT_400914 [Marasmius fiardii PR-910]|nr:hypothetical protein L218DRAFT_400914 [Marasmius fiardii PR-910]
MSKLTSLLTVPSLLDRVPGSLSSSSRSSSSYSFFGSNNGKSWDSGSHTEPETESESESELQSLPKRHADTKIIQAISPQTQVQCTPKLTSCSLKRRVTEMDCGYESDLEHNIRGDVALWRKEAQKAQKKWIKQQQQQLFDHEQVEVSTEIQDEPLIGLGLNLKRLSTPTKISRPVIPKKPILKPTSLPNSPSPLIPLPSPLVSFTCFNEDNDLRPSFSPLILMSSSLRIHTPSSPLPWSLSELSPRACSFAGLIEGVKT